MKFRIVVLPGAQADLLRNAEWWAKNQSAEKAAEWLDAVQAQLGTIADFPESHAISVESAEFPYPIRDRLVGLGSRPAFRAVFTIRGDTVFVLTVRRCTQDRLQPGDIDFSAGN
ncbi:MAG: type II toxin-antitoxin system RelE/ParE family toxin [Planctomycetaceae bacterium]